QYLPWRWIGGGLAPALFVPVASVVGVGMALRAGWLAVRRGGLMWRGTLYPLEQMRSGARFQFP
ncbi:MAG: hypothetical protein AB1716_20565, partial [Planctomycetota bacterium]